MAPGLHKCTLRSGHKSKEQEHQGKEALKTVMCKFPGLMRNVQARAGACQAMEDGNPELADYILETYQDTQIYNSAQKEMYINMAGKEKHVIDAVATVKKTQDRHRTISRCSGIYGWVAFTCERVYNINFVAAQSCDPSHAAHRLYGL